MSNLGLYRPGGSLLHRTPAGVKLLALLAALPALSSAHMACVSFLTLVSVSGHGDG